MIGAFGDITFETSDQKVLTMKNHSKTVAGSYASHNIIGQKPRQEYTGAQLDKLTFSVDLKAALGVDVQAELSKWERMASAGEAYPLVIGEHIIGNCIWIVTGISEAWSIVHNDGTIVSAAVDVTLEEYGGFGLAPKKPVYITPAPAVAKREGFKLIYSPPAAPQTTTGTVTANSLNVRNGAGMDADITGGLKKGAKVNIVSKEGEWYKLDTGQYVSAKYVS